MAKYVFIHTGGEKAAPQEEWISWLRSLTDSVAEAGYPFFGESATVNSSGVTSEGASRVGGYTIVNADSIDDAAAMAKAARQSHPEAT